MRRLVIAATLALFALTISVGTPAVAAQANSPVFGTAKVAKLDTKQMKSVVGQGTTSAYYAYLGNVYAGYAINYASYAMYLELFSGYTSTRDTYYYGAYSYAYQAAQYYYYAYYYN